MFLDVFKTFKVSFGKAFTRLAEEMFTTAAEAGEEKHVLFPLCCYILYLGQIYLEFQFLCSIVEKINNFTMKKMRK